MWKKVVRSDESKLNLFQGTVKHSSSSVMVWGHICGNEKGMLVQLKDKMDRFQYLEIPENAMIPSAWSIKGLDYIFIHENESCHKAHLITDWMDENDINCTTWPE